MNITDLLISLNVEVTQLLTMRVLESLLEVVVQTAPASSSLVGDLIVLIQALSALSGIEFLVKVAQCGGELVGESVLLVQCDGLLNRTVTDNVSVCQVLGDNARAWLVFLGDLVLFFGLLAGGLATGDVVDVLG